MKNLLVAPKDKDEITKKSGVIYRPKCAKADCEEEHIGESAKMFGERFKEHLRSLSPIYDHSNTSGHHISVDSFSILGREMHSIIRTIKEPMYIRVYDPSLKRNIGRSQLPNLWNDILQDTSGLHVK